MYYYHGETELWWTLKCKFFIFILLHCCKNEKQYYYINKYYINKLINYINNNIHELSLKNFK